MAIIHPSLRPAVTASDRVLLEIQRAIVEGEIAAGSKISEPELAKRFDLSRAPLREALARLERCHLIERIPNAGARVVKLSTQGLLSLYQLRETLEVAKDTDKEVLEAAAIAERAYPDATIAQVLQLPPQLEIRVRRRQSSRQGNHSAAPARFQS